MPAHLAIRVMAASAIILLFVVGCSASHVTYLESNSVYTSEDTSRLFTAANSASVMDKPVSDAPELRQKALVALRGEAGGGVQAANMITETFPSDTRGVPLYVERATYETVPALFVVEATGAPGGKFTDVRLWVLDASGTVLFSALERTP